LFFLYNCITYLRLRLFFRLKPFPSDLLIPVVSVVFSFLTFWNCGFPSTNHFHSSCIPVSRFYGSRLKKQQGKQVQYACFRCLRVLVFYYHISLSQSAICTFLSCRTELFLCLLFCLRTAANTNSAAVFIKPTYVSGIRAI